MGATYTRYADDIAFSGSGDAAARVPKLLPLLAEIALAEGYRLNDAKTRLMPAHRRQMVTGIVVNAHNNIARDDFDALKALMFNFVRFGAASQNHEAHADFRAHLSGRVGWVEQVNPARGAKLRTLYKQIAWS